MNIKYLGQSCFHIHMNGKNIIIDPFISGNSLASHIDIDKLSVDYILVTHGHEDHVLDVEALAKRTDALIISNAEIASWYADKGLKTHGMNHGGHWKLDFGTVKYVNAIHSSTMPDGASGGNPGGFVIWDDNQCIYHAGDTALTYDMKLIPMLCPKVDVAILPIGDNFTMGYKEAALASEFIACNNIIGCHYDTFGFIEIDHTKAVDHFVSKGIKLNLMDIGEDIEI